jgi:AraC-like DNA-binding protein
MLYLSAIVLAFFLALLLLGKKRKSDADFILFFWLMITGLHLCAFYLFHQGLYKEFGLLIVAGDPLPLAQGPFLYLYTRYATGLVRFKKTHLLHFLPVLLIFISFSPFFTLTTEEQHIVFEREGEGFKAQMTANSILIYLSGIVYIAAALRSLLRYRKNLTHRFSNTEKINFKWLLYLIIWIGFIWAVILVLGEGEYIFAAASVFILWLGYFGLHQETVLGYKSTPAPSLADTPINTTTAQAGLCIDPLSEVAIEPAEKYKKSGLKDLEAERIHRHLIDTFHSDKPFLNPDLTLVELAKQLGVQTGQLSQVINALEQKNFYDLINEWRVAEVIQRLKDPRNKQYTLLAIALESGFNSKASFNRNFKKITGQTPGEYYKCLSPLKG